MMAKVRRREISSCKVGIVPLILSFGDRGGKTPPPREFSETDTGPDIKSACILDPRFRWPGTGNGPRECFKTNLRYHILPLFARFSIDFPGKQREEASLPPVSLISGGPQPAAPWVSRSSVTISFSRENSTTAPLPCQEASHFWKSAWSMGATSGVPLSP